MKRLILFVSIVCLSSLLNAQVVDSAITTRTACDGTCDGTIIIYASGPVQNYYVVGVGAQVGDSVFTGLCPGAYEVYVDDGLAVSSPSVFVTVQDGTGPTLSVMTINNATCNGFSDGAIYTGITGGNGPFVYSGTDSSADGFLTNIPAGNYSISVVDANFCRDTLPVVVTEPSAIVISTLALVDASCNGFFDGEISMDAVGGDGVYTYSWSNGATTLDLFGLQAGTYTLTVTDGASCQGVSSPQTIGEPMPLLGTISVIDSISCFGMNDGKLTVTTSGGTTPYSYLWPNTGSTIDTAYNVSAGFNDVEITDANGCYFTTNITLIEPSQLVVSLTSTAVSCAGLCDGTLAATPSGGTAPYTYLWDDANAQTTATATGLCQTATINDYSVTITDTNGCVITESSVQTGVIINEPDSLDVSIVSVNATCSNANGSATATVFGGTTPYTLSWSNGGTGFTETNLYTGDYALNIVDSNGCTVSDTAYVGVDVIPVDVCVVTVDTTSTKNVIVWTKPIATGIKEFKVYRDVVGTYTYVASVPYDSLSEFVDNTNGVNPAVTQYRYKISVVDSCGNESTLSNYHQTIHLNAPAFSGNTADLVWQAYSGFVNNYYYRILRDTTLNNNWVAVDSVSSTTLVYTDIAVPTSGTVRYFVEIAFPGTCTASKAIDHNTTRSNRATITNGNPNSISENTELGVSIYPNPSNGKFALYFENELLGADISIFDVQGKLLYSKTITSGGTQNFDISDFETGMYLVKISSDRGESMIRVVKQ